MQLADRAPRFSLSPGAAARVQLGLRWVLGAVVMYRAVLVLLTARHVHDYVSYAWHGLLTPETFILLGGLLVVGVADRWAFAMLAVSYVAHNWGVKQMNLGPLVMTPLFVLGAVNAAEPGYSLGVWLRSRLPRRCRGIDFPIACPAEQLSPVLTWVFFCYALNSFCAVLYHLQDESWLHGETVWKIFTNSYLCCYFESFRAAELKLGLTLPLCCSAAALLSQTIFQFGMWPMACTRPGSWWRLFVILQGYAFFLLSWILIQLSVLPLVEIVTWTVLFGGELKAWCTRAGRALLREQPAVPAAPAMPVRWALLCVFMISATAFTTAFVLTPSLSPMLARVAYPVRDALISCGIWPPNVLNETDLEMGQTYFVLYEEIDGKLERVPVFHENGARDRYQSSDLIFFGMTLPFCRASTEIPTWDLCPPSMYDFVRNVARVHLGFSGVSGEPRRFVYKVIRDRSMNLRLPPAVRYAHTVIGEGSFELNAPPRREPLLTAEPDAAVR